MSHSRLSTGVFAFAVTSGSAALALDVQPRIIGGCESSTDDHAYAVALATTTGQTEYQAQFCGGAFIHESWVLTAAHCLYETDTSGVLQPIDPTDVQILFDAHNLSVTTTANGVPVTDIIRHTSYDETNAASPFDIALLKLGTPQVGRTPVRLATAKPGEGFDALVVGWGDTDIDPGVISYSTTLQEVNIETWSNAACSAALPGITLTDDQLCAGTELGGQDSCQGDSGGPVLLDTPNGITQVGIVSFGYGCALPNTPGVNTSVDAYLAWIETNTFNATTGLSDVPAATGVGEAFSSLPSICQTSGTESGENTTGSVANTAITAVSLGSGSGASGHAGAAVGALSLWALLLTLVPLWLRRRPVDKPQA